MSVLLPETFLLGENDVFCGRGSRALNHKGNEHFRSLILSHVTRYMKARTKFEKQSIITEIVAHVKHRSPNGGFVKQDLESWRYYVISDTVAVS